MTVLRAAAGPVAGRAPVGAVVVSAERDRGGGVGVDVGDQGGGLLGGAVDPGGHERDLGAELGGELEELIGSVAGGIELSRVRVALGGAALPRSDGAGEVIEHGAGAAGEAQHTGPQGPNQVHDLGVERLRRLVPEPQAAADPDAIVAEGPGCHWSQRLRPVRRDRTGRAEARRRCGRDAEGRLGLGRAPEVVGEGLAAGPHQRRQRHVQVGQVRAEGQRLAAQVKLLVGVGVLERLLHE